ncbi:PAS domain-containing protein [Pelomonas sp. KK5]|uniref:PAS domain-containing protein n=1 Tax=Pelomonas sp. KK5 TaxID=1855730 RepID=UPI00097C5DF7|nr:PAS domain-containing protein [Pelomonas sp. KK5]
MASTMSSPADPIDLRSRATERLQGTGPDNHHPSPAESLRILFELASSPASAPAALALLHELQVHQVELEMQSEEFRDSLAELEAVLARHLQLHDCAPAASLVVDAGGMLREVNGTGCRMLGAGREALLDMPLEGFLEPSGADALTILCHLLSDGAARACCQLALRTADGQALPVQASGTRHPSGDGYLLSLIESGQLVIR